MAGQVSTSGRIMWSTSIIASTTMRAQKSAATGASRETPKRRKLARKSAAVTASIRG
jgi:hypothetical protein